MKPEVSTSSVPTVLILVQQWTTPGNREGSVACTEQGVGSGITRSKPRVRVSHVWQECFLEGEIQRRMMMAHCHTVVYVAVRSIWRDSICARHSRIDRRIPNEGTDGIESLPNHDVSLHEVNSGSPTLVLLVKSTYQNGDGGSIVPNRWTLTGSAVGIKSDRCDEYKSLVTEVKSQSAGGKGDSLRIRLTARKEDC